MDPALLCRRLHLDHGRRLHRTYRLAFRLCPAGGGGASVVAVEAAGHRQPRQLPHHLPRQPRDRRPDRPGLPAGQLAGLMPLSILTTHGLLLFIGAELIFSLTPGPTVMLITAYGFKGGFRDALAAIAGTQTGNTLWYVICVTGLGALLTASPLLFHAIKLLGAAYLIWLGARALWKSWRAQEDAHGSTLMGKRLMGKPYIQAVLTQIANPKAILFFGA